MRPDLQPRPRAGTTPRTTSQSKRVVLGLGDGIGSGMPSSRCRPKPNTDPAGEFPPAVDRSEHGHDEAPGKGESPLPDAPDEFASRIKGAGEPWIGPPEGRC